MIKLRDITKKFDNQFVIDQFSSDFLDGQSYAIVGESGSGKTTLLNIIGKLEHPDSGSVIIDETDLDKIHEQDYFRNYVGYLFQNYGLIDNESIRQNLDLSFTGSKIGRSDQLHQMQAALKQVNLDLRLDRKIYSLSGGEAQRVAIAKIIIKNPDIILADEPTASLDEKNGQDIIDLLLSLMDEHKILIIATHSPNVQTQLLHTLKITKYQKKRNRHEI